MTYNFPNFNTRANVLGFSEEGVFIRSMRRAISISKRNTITEAEKFSGVCAQLDQALRRIEMSSAYKAGLEGKKHARIATAHSLHEDVLACIEETIENYNA
jgi:hypothetical protein